MRTPLKAIPNPPPFFEERALLEPFCAVSRPRVYFDLALTALLLWGATALLALAPGLATPLAAMAFAGGGLCALQGWLRGRFGAHEVLTALMLNGLVATLTTWLYGGPLRVGVQVHTASFAAGARLPGLDRWFPALRGSAVSVAALFAQRGWRVLATVRNEARAAELLAAIPEADRDLVQPVLAELSTPAEAQRAGEALLAVGVPIDVVVNNAGIAIGGFLEDQSEEELRSQFEVNLFAPVALLRALLPSMRARGRGRIVNVSSIGGRVGNPGLTPYCATKWALEGLSESLRFELDPLGIDVVLVEPGTYPTEIFTRNRKVARKATEGSSPYRETFARMAAKLDADVAANKKDPEEVARVLVEACEVARPALRYGVGGDTRAALLARWLLPWRLFEGILRGNFQSGARVEPRPPAER